MPTHPIHHITAICSNAQACLDFYVGVLGLRLVKRTINFDDPGTYHFYFGDETGSPGTILTFFPWDSMSSGRPGTGQTIATAYAVPAGSLEMWQQRLSSAGVSADPIATRFGERVLALRDGDGLVIELIETGWAAGLPAWANGDVPADMAVRAFHSSTISVDGYERTARVLREQFGYAEGASANDRFRFQTGQSPIAGVIDLLCQPDRRRGAMGTGTIHHIAFRAADDGEHLALRGALVQSGLNVTPVLDRTYFKSIYFREPGGVIFEVATDGPGMLIDEPRETLGESLRLPSWLEGNRQQIESILPTIHLPGKKLQ
jgi:glyoxalase family protein